MLAIAKDPMNILNALQNDIRWPVLYHFSDQRRNLLEWFEFGHSSSILEIGAGCGALTGLLCEKSDDVTAVELSKKRAEIIATRYKSNSNLSIFVGDIFDMEFNKRFDYITLIGVLEYACSYIYSANPFVDILKKAKGLLNEDGLLIIAIENKFGIKYWAGSREDHTGNYYDGLNNYRGVKSVRTFSENELKQILNEAGFDKNDFYYPVPDYKMPTQVYSDNFFPSHGASLINAPNYDFERLQLFDEPVVMDSLLKEGKFPFFSNSFLVFCKYQK
ncbi:bifunctional 2-polyprenyl-6-hydroxyphenol methylase/3-demethylubiquinol 3-O-methyltransferase UbiG [Paenibacillus sp. YYML68]|uniref:class I SAM-dependent methyltransferase n=1 Tax=Paenibacillus sp. YYML68 TaxID=2909250 RepID=UPI0024922F69|nr:methyltransferase [Paenibacillus sp. YYML68]